MVNKVLCVNVNQQVVGYITLFPTDLFYIRGNTKKTCMF